MLIGTIQNRRWLTQLRNRILIFHINRVKQDTVGYDSLGARPLPKWLTDQRDGLNAYQPEILTMKEDSSLKISLIITGAVIILTILILTLYFLLKNKNKLKS